MSLENKINELKKKLALKEAYLNVNFTFPRGNRISDKVKEQVTNELKKACTQLAEHEEYTLDIVSDAFQTSNFTPEETNILKEVAASIVKKALSGSDPVKPETSEKISKPKVLSKARIIMLDSVDKTMRNKIESQAEVKIIGSNDGKHFVETIDEDARRFWINTDDLDFNV